MNTTSLQDYVNKILQTVKLAALQALETTQGPAKVFTSYLIADIGQYLPWPLIFA